MQPQSLLTRANATLLYLAAILLLGGASAAGFAANLVLQLAGAALLGWTLWAQTSRAKLDPGLRRFVIAVAILGIVQFLPLPPGLWRHLPGRDLIWQGYGLLGSDAPWLTLSFAPWDSLGSIGWLIPALALFVALRSDDAPSTRQLVWTIATVAGVSVLLGIAQRGVGSGYIYAVTNFGEGPGFFANSNHQGSFLLVVFALCSGQLAMEVRARRGQLDWSDPPLLVNLCLVGLMAFGVIVSGSLACVALLLPTTLAVVMINRPQWHVSPIVLVLASLGLLAALFIFLLLGPVANDLTAKGVVAGISRQEFLITGSRIMRDFAPFGTGLGTFQDIYRWYENPAIVGTTFVNHAHDDLLELLIETGIFGLAAVAAFAAWFVPKAFDLWRNHRDNAMALAASVMIAVELAHSLVDYPLRTAAMSSMFALACVLLMRDAEPIKQGRARRARRDDGMKPKDMIRL